MASCCYLQWERWSSRIRETLHDHRLRWWQHQRRSVRRRAHLNRTGPEVRCEHRDLRPASKWEERNVESNKKRQNRGHAQKSKHASRPLSHFLWFSPLFLSLIKTDVINYVHQCWGLHKETGGPWVSGFWNFGCLLLVWKWTEAENFSILPLFWSVLISTSLFTRACAHMATTYGRGPWGGLFACFTLDPSKRRRRRRRASKFKPENKPRKVR